MESQGPTPEVMWLLQQALAHSGLSLEDVLAGVASSSSSGGGTTSGRTSSSGGGSAPAAGRAPAAGAQARAAKQGASRRHRDDNTVTLTGPLGALAPSLITTPSPVVPLRFEQPPGSWRGFDYICIESNSVAQSFADNYASPEVLAAHYKALAAYGAPTPAAAEEGARLALALSPLCPEAYNVLAMAAAGSCEEALELYRRAEALGPQVLKPGLWEDCVGDRELWMKPPYRAHYRALYGVANTLRKMGRYEEALVAYDKLLELDPNWYSYPSYVNVRALYPYVLLGAKGPEALLRYFRQAPDAEGHFNYISSSVYHTSAYLLADLLVSQAKGTNYAGAGAKVTPDDNFAADGVQARPMAPGTFSHWDCVSTGLALLGFTESFFHAVDLLGDAAMPPGVSPVCQGAIKEDAAVGFVYTCGAQWRRHATAMDRLRRYRNTYELQMLLVDLRAKLEVSISDIRKYMNAPGGFHPHATTWDAHGVRTITDLLCNTPDGQEFTKDELKVLKWLLDAGCPVHNPHPKRIIDDSIHMACYQGYGPEAVRLLLEYGGDPLRGNTDGLSALLMTANQGNWREMQAVFRARPELKHSTKESHHAGGTTGGAVLLHGCALPAGARMAGPRSPFTRLSKHVLRLLEGQKGKHHHQQQQQQHQQQHQQQQQQQPAAAAPSSTARASSAAPASPTGSRGAGGGGGSSNGTSRSAASSGDAASSGGLSGDAASSGGLSGPAEKKCWNCGAAPGKGAKLKKCQGCHRAFYCSQACQHAQWKAHKPDCKRWQGEQQQQQQQ